MWIGVVYLALMTLIWGFVPILVKIALRAIDPFSLTFLRIAIGGGSLTLIYALRGKGKGLRGIDFRSPINILGGVSAGINFTLFTVAVGLSRASVISLGMQLQVVCR
jgi:uncharacterized membrane protein